MRMFTDHAADNYYFYSFLPAKGCNTMFKMSTKANPNKVYNFTGISDAFDEPIKPDLVIDTKKLTLNQSIRLFEQFIHNPE